MSNQPTNQLVLNTTLCPINKQTCTKHHLIRSHGSTDPQISTPLDESSMYLTLLYKVNLFVFLSLKGMTAL